MNIELMSKDEIRIQIFKALSDETRLNIIRFLRDKGSEISCGEIGENFNITKSAASYHFKILREAGLTSTRKEFQSKYVKLRLETFEEYLPKFLELL